MKNKDHQTIQAQLEQEPTKKHEPATILGIVVFVAVVLAIASFPMKSQPIAAIADLLVLCAAAVSLCFVIKGDEDCLHPLAHGIGWGTGMILGHTIMFGQIGLH